MPLFTAGSVPALFPPMRALALAERRCLPGRFVCLRRGHGRSIHCQGETPHPNRHRRPPPTARLAV